MPPPLDQPPPPAVPPADAAAAPPGPPKDQAPPVDPGTPGKRLGLIVQPHVSIAALTYSWGNTHIVSGGATADASLPAIVLGAGLKVGYDLSAITRLSDTSASLGVSLLGGSGSNTSALLLPIDLWFEKAFRFGNVKVAGAIGPTMQFSWVTLKSSGTAVPSDLHFAAGAVFGPALRIGAGLALRNDLEILLEGVGRLPLNTPSYSEGDGKPIPDAWNRREDHFATMGVNLGIGKTF